MDFTKYELARLIGARALQLSLGAPPLVKASSGRMSFIEIAEEELAKGVLPLAVTKVSA